MPADPADPIAEAVAAERSLLTSPALSADTDPSNNYRSNLGHDRCYACGGIHGGVNQGIWCLQVHLRSARGLLGRCRALALALSSMAEAPSSALLRELLALLTDAKGAR
jgi:hypothetical protein